MYCACVVCYAVRDACGVQWVLCSVRYAVCAVWYVLYGVCYVHGPARAMYIGYYDVCIINSYPQVRKSEKDPRKSKPMCLAAVAAAC